MKIKIVFLLISLLGSWNLMAQPFTKSISISCSENDAVIYANSKEMGKGSAEVIVPRNGSLIVEVKKPGYLPASTYFYNMKNQPSPPKTYHFILEKDDSYDASSTSDNANIDFEIKTSKTEDEAWKLLNIIILNYFDNLETQDKSTGYLRTAWIVQSFKQNTVRTKIILKLSSITPLAYKVKLLSECSDKSSTSVKNDEMFKPWDRVLRKYADIISEMQSRLK